MLLDLTRIHGPREHVERTYDASALDTARDEFRVVSDEHLSFDIWKNDARYRLVGRVVTTLELSCSRCAEPFRWPVDASFDVTYLPLAANTGDDDEEISEEDLESAFYANGAIDLGQLMREQFYLALPMKPLCSDDCKGLCSLCGVNRNTGSCTCDTEWRDPRLDPLRGILGGTPGDR